MSVFAQNIFGPNNANVAFIKVSIKKIDSFRRVVIIFSDNISEKEIKSKLFSLISRVSIEIKNEVG